MRFKKGLLILLYIMMLLGCLAMVFLVEYVSGGKKPAAEPSEPVREEASVFDALPATPSGWSPAFQEQNENSQGEAQACEEKTDRAYGRHPAAAEASQMEPEISAQEEPQEPPALMLASDLHFISRATHDGGTAFQSMAAQDDGKISGYSEEIVDALVEEAIRTRPAALVLAGDITLNGEKINHQDLAGKLRRAQEAGVPVLVIPGNHDIQNQNAATYFGEERQAAEYLTGAEDFLEIYHEFGYDQASSRDSASLSYVYPLDEGHWMMMLDSCQYEGRNHVNGRIKPETLAWMREQLSLAREAGAVVLPVAHHNLLSESRLYTTECTLENHLEVIRLLEEYELPLFISGHLHAQRIKKHKDAPGVPEDAYGITEIVLSSYSIPPCQYGYLAWDEQGGMSFETRQADVAGMAAEQGSEDELLLEFDRQGPEYMKGLIREQVKATITCIPEDLSFEMAQLYAELYYDYCAGNAMSWNSVLPTKGYKLWQRMDPDGKYVKEMEEMIADGKVEMKGWEKKQN